MSDDQPAIDLVYTWVDGDCPAYQAVVRSYAGEPAHTNPERTRDLYSLLRHSLRSVAMFVPWVRNIFIVTSRPQVPAWLALDNPRVRVVHHDQLPGLGEYLPTFNSNVIESFLHAIPGLADHFLYLNDDFLFGAPTARQDFLAPDGRHRVLGTFFGEWLPFRVYERRWKLFKSAHLEHCPLLVYKPYWEEMLAANRKRLRRTRKNRFRTGADLRMDRLYRMWMLGPMRRRSQAVPARELLRYHRFHPIENDRAQQAAGLAALERMRPKFYCLNDDQQASPDPWVCERVREFLGAYYPEPSEFERT